MPIECDLLEGLPAPFDRCPNCGRPFEPFLRGQVQRWAFRFLLWGYRPHCALICRACKEIVGYEDLGGDWELLRKYR